MQSACNLYNVSMETGESETALLAGITRELSVVHHDGGVNVDEADVPLLLSLRSVRMRASGPSATARRTALAGLLEKALLDLAERDRLAAKPLFGLGEYAHVGLGDRHVAALRHLPARNWDSFRGQPFQRFRTAVAKALIAHDEEMARSGAHEADTLANEYIVVRLSSEYIVPTVDDPSVTIIQNRRLRALTDGLTTWSQTYNYLSNSMTGPPRYSVTGPGQLNVQIGQFREQAGDGYVADISVEFETPVAHGKEVEFQLVHIEPRDLDRYWSAGPPYFHIITPSDPIQELEIAIRLDSQRQPHRLRRLDGVPPSQKYEAGAKPSAVVAVGAGARVASSWKAPRRRRSYGFTWDRKH